MAAEVESTLVLGSAGLELPPGAQHFTRAASPPSEDASKKDRPHSPPARPPVAPAPTGAGFLDESIMEWQDTMELMRDSRPRRRRASQQQMSISERAADWS